MNARRASVLAAWLCFLAVLGVVIARARFITDLSAFLPAKPTPMQRLLVDQLRDGPTSRLVLIALEQGDAAARAAISSAMLRRLRADPAFSYVDNGGQATADRDREFLFHRRYLLSKAVDAARFSAQGLHRAIESTVLDLASPEGLLIKPLVPHDPTGEMLAVIDQLARNNAPRTRGGVWVSADGERALLVAETATAGSDTDAQQRAQALIRAAFAAVAGTSGSQAVRLRMSGPGVFAVAARTKIKTAAIRLSIVSSALVMVILLAVYRSLPALLLGLAPVVTGALAGIAAVALGFGAVHGITLGFGITLIGESVDYSIYFFIQALRGGVTGSAAAAGAARTGLPQWREGLWPTIRLGMLTSVCGFASLLPSGFPGLAQLGAYSISGLAAAAVVTRFVLPELLPARFAIRDLTALGVRIARLLAPARGLREGLIAGLALAVAALALTVLYRQRGTLWNRELSALSPVSQAEQRYDAKLRADLGAADVLDLVVVSGDSLESVLQGAERTASTLESLVEAKVIGGFDSPANYLPSQKTQAARRASLPDADALRSNLAKATAGLALDSAALLPFIDDVATARNDPLIAPAELRGTSLAAGFDALILREADRWDALLPLHAADPRAPTVDLARVSAALAADGPGRAELLDFKREADALYASYLKDAIRLCAAGFAAIAVLLGVVLRSAMRAARVLAPLILAVLTVAASLSLAGVELTLMHLVGLLLIVAVGSNYALFFDAQRSAGRAPAGPAATARGALGADAAALTLASLSVANLCTVIGFGLLSFSGVPVLEALGTTVAPGAFLALVFASILTPRDAVRP